MACVALRFGCESPGILGYALREKEEIVPFGNGLEGYACILVSYLGTIENEGNRNEFMDTLTLQQEEDVEQLVRMILRQNQIQLAQPELAQVVELFSQEWRDVIPEHEYESKILELAYEVNDGFDDV